MTRSSARNSSSDGVATSRPPFHIQLDRADSRKDSRGEVARAFPELLVRVPPKRSRTFEHSRALLMGELCGSLRAHARSRWSYEHGGSSIARSGVSRLREVVGSYSPRSRTEH